MDSHNPEFDIIIKKSTNFKPLPVEEIITSEVVQDIFKHFDPNVQVLGYECAKGTNVGDNYLSLMYTLDVQTSTQKFQHTNCDAETDINTSPTIVVFNLMFKTIPRNPIRIQMIQPLKMFEREILMYRYILPILTFKYDFNSLPFCLHTMYNGTTDYIAMKNVQHNGFKMLPRYQCLDLHHATFAVQELAKFHATSYKEWNGDGDLILSKFPILTDAFWIEPGQSLEMNRMFVENTFPELEKLLVLNNCDAELCAKLTEFSRGISGKMCSIIQKSCKYPNVVNHGDPWTNNFLFKYDEQGDIANMKFVDFQVAKVGSRVIDLSYLLYTSLQLPVMNEMLMDLVRIYYDTFMSEGVSTEIDAFDLTWESFLIEWNCHRLYGLTMALLFCPAMFANPENIPDMETISMDDITGKLNKKDDEVDKNNFSDFMKSDYTFARVFNLLKYHI